MNFREAEEYLLSLGNEVSTMKLGLENISRLLHALGDPHYKYLKVQVAGTNGKGSVCAFLDSICNTSGIRTGTFTSPHLVSITERVRINGSDIAEDEFARHASAVRKTAQRLVNTAELNTIPTFFEQLTAIALLAFADADVQLAILETGLGGRLDATTAARAEIAVLTRIDLDHQQYLGATIEEIAREKAAIIRPGVRTIVARQNAAAEKVILDKCNSVGVQPMSESRAFTSATDLSKRSMAVGTNRGSGWNSSLGLIGTHQIENAAAAVLVAESLRSDFGLKIGEADILAGLEDARHPGRIEYSGQYLFDGAHNVAGANALAAFIRECESRQITLVFGAMKDKDVAEILQILAPLALKIVLTEPNNARALTYCELLDALPGTVSPENVFLSDRVASALEIAETITVPGGIILVTGSLYLIGDVKKLQEFEI